jgi:hypothetical protein
VPGNETGPFAQTCFQGERSCHMWPGPPEAWSRLPQDWIAQAIAWGEKFLLRLKFRAGFAGGRILISALYATFLFQS